jgi:predicted DNA repair protein MutK
MATSFFALLDDIATILDDIAILTKVAAKKTAGVLGDDLALNANQVTGLDASREIPVVWAVAKGSFLNKLILVPSALVISALAPWLVIPLLMVGGAYLCFEGVEKLAHRWLHAPEELAAHEKALMKAVQDHKVDLVALEKSKIRGAIRTDFILSAEIVVISLGTVANSPFLSRLFVLSLISILMTVGVYGLVGGIVKLDDLGLWMSRKGSALGRSVGSLLLVAAPWLLKALSVIGTIAMFLVGGGIVLHGIPGGVEFIHQVLHGILAIPVIGTTAKLATEGGFGVLVGALVLAGVQAGKKAFARP